MTVDVSALARCGALALRIGDDVLGTALPRTVMDGADLVREPKAQLKPAWSKRPTLSEPANTFADIFWQYPEFYSRLPQH